MEMFFKNRAEAGEKLADILSEYKNQKDVIVYGLLRGGVPVAKQITKRLSLLLEPLIIRKIGHPYNPEYAIGAMSEDGEIVGSQAELDQVDPVWLKQEIKRQKEEIASRKDLYFKGRKSIDPKDKIAIIVDDGAATGFSLHAAINYLREKKVRKIIVALPVVPKELSDKIKQEVDQLTAVLVPEFFLGAISAYYDEFSQVPDEEVLKLLNDPVLFSMPVYDYLASNFLDVTTVSKGRYHLERFEDKEIKISVLHDVSGDDCIILGTLAPPEQNLAEVLLLAHTLKKEGAKGITLILPYLSYMRQDVDEPGMSLAADWVAKIAQSSGINRIVTIDIHSQFAANLFQIPIDSLSPAKIFASELEKKLIGDTTLIAPDEGAIRRCEALKRELNVDIPIAYFEKEHHWGEVSPRLVGELSPNVVILDDILDTGTTLISACKILKDRGVQNITIMVSHGLFINPLWEDLWQYNVSDIYTTDSVPIRRSVKAKGVKVISIAPLLKEYIEKNLV